MEFSFTLTQQFPEKNFLLFEIRIPFFLRLEKLFSGFPHVSVFDGDAGRNFRLILEPLFQSGVRVEKIFVNFPDPWFKEKHKKRRFITQTFLQECAEYFVGNPEFLFQTDQEFLFQETLEIVQQSAFSHVVFFDEPPFGVVTEWESVKRKENPDMKIWRMRFQKNEP